VSNIYDDDMMIMILKSSSNAAVADADIETQLKTR
jgi:hypothetical protein